MPVKHIWFVGECHRENEIPYLSCSIPCVPKGIPEVLSRASSGVYDFNRQPRVTLGLSRFVWPVGLCNLLPHYDIKPGTGLVTKHKASIVIIPLSVDEESSAEVHCIELVVTWWRRFEVSTLSLNLYTPQIVTCYVLCYSPTAMPGSQLTVWTSSLPWWRTTQLGSICEVPLGSRGTIWNLRKSVSLMSKFSGQTS